MKTLEMDTGIELVGFSKKEVKKLIKKGKKFRMEIPAVISRDMMDVTVKVKSKKLDITVYFSGIEDDAGDQNAQYECKKSAKDLEKLMYELLYTMYT